MAEQCKAVAGKGTFSEGKRKRHHNLTAAQVMEKLKNAGVKNLDKVSGCVKAGIARGHIQLESAADLDTVIASKECWAIDPMYGNGYCSHTVSATLQMVLHQGDDGGGQFNGNGGEYAVMCKECEAGYYFVRDICTGKAALTGAKWMKHCNDCPGFGACYAEYRWKHCVDCGKHYFHSCECEEKRYMEQEDSEWDDEDDEEHMQWLFGTKNPRKSFKKPRKS